MGIAHAAAVNTSKNTYNVNENIVVNFSEMLAHNDDWIGVYATGSTNAWENVIRWSWTNDVSDGEITFNGLPSGSYEVRAFYNNSYVLEASKIFTVGAVGGGATVNTSKNSYLPNESIVSNYTNMSGSNKDWIGIYPAGTTNAWGNMIQWEWIAGNIAGAQTFNPLPAGNYEVRVFFNNSLVSEAIHAFSVAIANVGLTTEKATYNPNEIVHATFDSMRGVADDWIGIFPVGAGDAQADAVQWRSTNSQLAGTLSFDGLIAGSYEVRSYFGVDKQKTVAITVLNIPITSVLFDDSENGINPEWVHYAGIYDITRVTPGANESLGAVRMRAYWVNGANPSGYYLPLSPVATGKKVLNIDMRARANPHFNFGLIVETKNGTRRIIWDSFFNHNGNPPTNIVPPFHSSNGYILNNPAPDDYHYFGSTQVFRHYKINVEKTLRHLEPDNEIVNITGFTCTGGEYDNITLSSH
jgi:uncharacterized protein (DUF2141 family)